jgi:hypothetical protein
MGIELGGHYDISNSKPTKDTARLSWQVRNGSGQEESSSNRSRAICGGNAESDCQLDLSGTLCVFRFVIAAFKMPTRLPC